MKHTIQISSLLLALSTASCASDTDLETAFCDGLAAPAERTVDATSTMSDAPNVTDEARVDIQLIEGRGGFVTYVPDEPGSFAFGFSAPTELVIRDENGTVVPLDETVTGAACADLAVRYTASLDLQVYRLELVGAEATTVGFIAEESDDDL